MRKQKWKRWEKRRGNRVTGAITRVMSCVEDMMAGVVRIHDSIGSGK